MDDTDIDGYYANIERQRAAERWMADVIRRIENNEPPASVAEMREIFKPIGQKSSKPA